MGRDGSHTGLPRKPFCKKGKRKVKEVDLYSAFIEVPYTQGTQVQITVLPANYTVPASTL